MARLVARVGSRSAIVSSQLFKIGEDGQSQFAAESIAAKLERGRRVRSDVDGALLGFDEKLPQGADAEGVIRVFLVPFHLQAVFWTHLPVLRRSHRPISDVPSEGLKQRVDQRLANVGFVDAGSEEDLAVGGEVLTQLRNLVFALVNGHIVSVGRHWRWRAGRASASESNTRPRKRLLPAPQLPATPPAAFHRCQFPPPFDILEPPV